MSSKSEPEKTFIGRRSGYLFRQPRPRTRPFGIGPENMSRKLMVVLDEASSSWGHLDVDDLEEHLRNPAPPYTLISSCDDEGWVASENPETIYYVVGIDFYDCSLPDCTLNHRRGINWIEVPARLLRDRLLDYRDALRCFGFEVQEPDDADSIRSQTSWPDVGKYYDAIKFGSRYAI